MGHRTVAQNESETASGAHRPRGSEFHRGPGQDESKVVYETTTTTAAEDANDRQPAGATTAETE